MSMEKRIDVALVERGLCKSRARAQNLLKDGSVLLNGIPCMKPSVSVSENDTLELTGNDIPYVGRGGLKLQEAIMRFNLSVAGRICLDIGASTGGFTDCMLQNGAAKVYAVDVGHDQLDDQLRRDHRVVNFEGTDVRLMRTDDLWDAPNFCSIDVSFISLTLILPAVYDLTAEYSEFVVLVKPQFEAGKSAVGKKGIVRSVTAHKQVLENVISFARQLDFSVYGLCPSPIRGGSGNTEYLLCLKKGYPDTNYMPDIPAVIHEAGLK